MPAHHELPEDDREVEAYPVEPVDDGAATQIMDEESVPGLPGIDNDNDPGQRDYLIDLWPFARPVGDLAKISIPVTSIIFTLHLGMTNISNYSIIITLSEVTMNKCWMTS